MTTNHIAAAREGAVQRIQINRPEKKNAITIEMYAALADASAAAEADRLVPLMLLHGAGDAFCAGNNWGRCIATAAKRFQHFLRPAFETFGKTEVSPGVSSSELHATSEALGRP